MFRLREGGESLLQSGGSAGESVFSAASGISVLRKILDELEKKIRFDLYKKSGSNPELNKLLKEEKELKKQISEYQLKIQTWKELERTYKENEQDIEDLLFRIKELRRQQEKLQRVKLILPKMAKLLELKERLAQLGNVPELPDGNVELRTTTQSTLDSAKKEKQGVEKELQEIQEKLRELSIPEKILEQAPIIDALYRELQSYQNHEKKIPELEGERKQLEAQVLSIMKEIDSAHAGLDLIDLYRLASVKKETIRELSKGKPLLDQKLEAIEKELKELTKEWQQKINERNAIPDLPNLDELESVIDQVKRAGNIEQTLKTRTVEKQQKERQIEDEIRRLPLWDGTYQEFLQLQVPSLAETVKKFEKNRNDLLQKWQKTKDHILDQQKSIDEYEEQIRRIDSLAEIPSEEKLLTVRAKRETGWQFIKTKLEKGILDTEKVNEFTHGHEIAAVYEDRVRDADQLADTMRLEAEKVGEKNKLLSDIEICKEKMNQLIMEEKSWQSEMITWKEKWQELWKPAGMTPLSPEEMKEWLVKYEQITGLIGEYLKLNETIQELEKNQMQFKSALVTALQQLVDVSESQSLESMLNLAEKQQKKIRELENTRSGLDSRMKEIKEKIDQKESEKRNIEIKISEWKQAWNLAVQDTNISKHTSPFVAEKLLNQYESGVKIYDEMKQVEKEIESIVEQISLFKEKVIQVLRNVNISEDEQNPAIMVNKLNTMLLKAQQDQMIRDNFQAQRDGLQTRLKLANDEIDKAQAIISELLTKASCQNLIELIEVEKRFKEKQEYTAQIQRVEEEMLERGSGRSLQQLIEEAGQYESDRIEGELQEISRELERIENDRSELEQAYGVVKKEYQEKIQGNNSASVTAEQEKESILAQLSDAADQYIQVKLASVLLQKGIEHYRQQNQNPILQRASELFSRLTLGSLVELTVDYDEKDQPILMGVRENGEKVSIDGMSDGTKDQLYLSLRIASIEKYVMENEPIPFIVDDILVHFDDIRSKETLKILMELSKRTQIIFFTHHARLIEIMKEISSDQEYQLIEINHHESITPVI